MTESGGSGPDGEAATPPGGLVVKLAWAYAALVCLGGLVGLLWLRATT